MREIVGAWAAGVLPRLGASDTAAGSERHSGWPWRVLWWAGRREALGHWAARVEGELARGGCGVGQQGVGQGDGLVGRWRG